MRAFFSGGCSSVGRVPDCDSGCRGFEPHQSPQRKTRKTRSATRLCGFLFCAKDVCKGGGSGNC